MDNGIDKKALFKMKTEPYLKPISDLGVGFYNLDENTAIIQFQLTNDSGPLMLHENNVSSYAYFKSQNGSSSDVIDLEIVDSYNGIVQITLPKDFLQASTDTKVTGQVYIAVNNVSGKAEYNEVAVFREFDFEVKDALINKISSFTKIEYIRMFDQLKMEIEQRVRDIEEAIANGSDYVAEMKSVLQKGIETLNTVVSSGKTDIQAYITQAKKDVETSKTNAVNTMTQTKTDILKAIDDKKIVSSTQLDEKVNGLSWQKYKLTRDDGAVNFLNIKGDLEAYQSLAPGNYYTAETPISGASSNAGFTKVTHRHDGLVKHIEFRPYSSKQIWIKRFYNTWSDWEKVTTELSDLNVQKYKLTNDDGSRIYLAKGSFKDVTALPPGLYETVTSDDAQSQGFPPGINNSSFVEIDVMRGADKRAQIKVVVNYNMKTYCKTIHTNGVDNVGWKEMFVEQSDTGWIPFEIINGGRTNVAYDYGSSRNGYGCSYRAVTIGSMTQKFIRVNADNVAHNQIIAQLPANFAKSPQVGYIRAPLAHNGTSIIIENTGEVRLYISNSAEWQKSDGYYIYGTISWVE